MGTRASITVTPVLVADLLAEGERMPVYVHVVDHPAARVLVDTGIKELHPAAADLDPRIQPLSEQEFDLAAIESTEPGGARSGGTTSGERYFSLYDGYAADPGHLNHAGAEIAAAHLLHLIADTARAGLS